MRIEVFVKLFAKESKLEPLMTLEGLSTGNAQYSAYLTSAPIDGKANEELIDLLAKYFGIRKGQIAIISGAASKHKIIDITS
ncbi:MAG: DUF167 domain-containing protein [Candidatus Absconditabacterales bacterium]